MFCKNLRAVNLAETSNCKHADQFAQVSDIGPSWSSCINKQQTETRACKISCDNPLDIHIVELKIHPYMDKI